MSLCYYVAMLNNHFTIQFSHLREEAIEDIVTNYIYEAFYAGELTDEEEYNLYESSEQAIEDDDLRIEIKAELEAAFPANLEKGENE